MKAATILIVSTLVAGNALGRLGETVEQAAKRYGEPVESKIDTNTHATSFARDIRSYASKGVRIDATFLSNKSGESVIGEIRYTLPKEMSESDTGAALMRLLEANAEGQEWGQVMGVAGAKFFRRKDATAFTAEPSILTATLDQYSMRFVNGGWAVAGETAEEAAKRYGDAASSKAERYSNTVTRTYETGGIRTEATFFPSKSGKIVIGAVSYFVTQKYADVVPVPTTILLLVDANAGQQKWSQNPNGFGEQLSYFELQRPGVRARGCIRYYLFSNQSALTVTLDEYADFVAAEKRRIEAEQADRVGKQLKDF